MVPSSSVALLWLVGTAGAGGAWTGACTDDEDHVLEMPLALVAATEIVANWIPNQATPEATVVAAVARTKMVLDDE